ncbi:MAG: response regulator [Candidatus Omnitrophica bacterium]|nr:response regulator [Candidatus Omnitrophota bacterium]
MRRKKVMIVDDDKEFLEELRETLFLNGYEVIKVDDPHRVLDLAGNNKPDIILLDLKIDHSSGFEIADELSRFTRTIDIPVVAMTGFFTENEHISLMGLCGINKCITKPFSAEQIVTAIESELRKKV